MSNGAAADTAAGVHSEGGAHAGNDNGLHDENQLVDQICEITPKNHDKR